MALLHYKNITIDKVLAENDTQRKTKIVATIGPSSQPIQTLTRLVEEGLNVARMNFSHGDHESHTKTMKNVREASKTAGKPVALLLDTKGPEIRTGFLKGGEHEKVTLERGSHVEIVTDYEFKGDSGCIACSYEKLPQTVKVDDTILCADGSLVMKVVEVRDTSVVVEMQNTGLLGERKNMNLPGNKVDIPTITEKDANDLRTFAGEIDFVAVSFVQKGSDFKLVKDALGPAGKDVKIIAKIENQEGLLNFDSIVREFDGIMVARGDLGMEIPMEKVFLAQKYMIRRCNIYGKPAITATQMLESMTGNPRPTRAEATDVANAVLDGTDAVMLSGETAGGSYPIESVVAMANICREAESVINREKLFAAVMGSIKNEFKLRFNKTPSKKLDPEALTRMQQAELTETIAASAVKAQIDSHATLLIIVSEDDEACSLVAKYRPNCPILLLTTDERVARQMSGVCSAVFVEIVDRRWTVESVLTKGYAHATRHSWVEEGDHVVILKRVKSNNTFTHFLEVGVIPAVAK